MGKTRWESIQTPNSQTRISSRLYHFLVVTITNSWHPECKGQNTCYLWDFCLFTFLPLPCHYIFPRDEVALSWKVTFAGGQADGSSHRQAQFSSLTMCHSKALKISVLQTPGLLQNLGHWQHKDLLKAPACDTDPPRTIPHPRDAATAKSACIFTTIWDSGFFFIIIISCPAPAVLVSLARVFLTKAIPVPEASDLPSALP